MPSSPERRHALDRHDLPSERPGRPPPPALAELRRLLAAGKAGGAFAVDPPPVGARIGGLRVLRFLPDCEARGRLIHFHGGAFRNGAPEVVGRYARRLADACGIEVICPQYRLAPEHPFPAALADAVTVATALTAGPPPILAGDSAGGGLAVALAALCVSRDLPVAGLVLHSPWLDLTVSSPAYTRNAASDALFSRAAAAEAAELYLQGAAATTPLASPLFLDPGGLPPTFVSVGEDEVLADDAIHFAERLAAAGVPVELCAQPRMEHVAVTRRPDAAGAVETFRAMVAFLEQRLVVAGTLGWT